MLKRNPSLTEQAKSYLKQRIVNNEFEDGRIPSESDLAKELNVSRSTIREAFSRLEAEGIIYRKQGSGTFVNQTGLRIKIRLEEIWDYESVLQAHGYTPSVQLISAGEKPASPKVAAALEIDEQHPVIVVQKLFLADNDPVILTDNYLPRGLVQSTYQEQDCRKPISQFLSQFCNQELSYFFSEAVPLLVPEWLAHKLNLTMPQAILSFEETGYNQHNEPIVKGISYFRDDLLRFGLIRRQSA